MFRRIVTGGLVLVLFASMARFQPPAAAESLADTLKKIEPHVVPEDQREALRSMLGRSLREQIAAANRKSSAEWVKIDTREAWERFRNEKIAALRSSLGSLPERPARPQVLITGELPGERFKIQN